MIQSLCHLVMAAAAATVALASCVPALPGELDPARRAPQEPAASPVAAAPPVAASPPAAAPSLGAAATSGPIRDAGQGGGASTPVMCDPRCTRSPAATIRRRRRPARSRRSNRRALPSTPSTGETAAGSCAPGGTSTVSPNPAQPFHVSCVGAAGKLLLRLHQRHAVRHRLSVRDPRRRAPQRRPRLRRRAPTRASCSPSSEASARTPSSRSRCRSPPTRWSATETAPPPPAASTPTRPR